MDIERYAERSLPWNLGLDWKYRGDALVSYGDPEDSVTLVIEIGEDCPRAGEYEFGNYWRRTENAPGTRRFIRDRLEWAGGVLSGILREKEEELEDLKGRSFW